MPSPDELRDLIERVEKAGGPLRVGREHNIACVLYGAPYSRGPFVTLDSVLAPPPACDTPHDILAGVLRRDIEGHGHVLAVWYSPESARGEGNEHLACSVHVLSGTIKPRGEGDERDLFWPHKLLATGGGPNVLLGYLGAWLEANRQGLVGRPPRDDLYDGRMPRDDE